MGWTFSSAGALSSNIVSARTTHDFLNANFSRPTFDYIEFWRILTAAEFPEKDAKSWIQNHYYFTFQVTAFFIRYIRFKQKAKFLAFYIVHLYNIWYKIFNEGASTI